MTVDADRAEHAFVGKIVRRCIADPLGVLQLAAQGHCETMVLGLEIERGTIRRSIDREEARAIGQFDELRNDDARRPKCHVDIPHRTGAAIFGEME